MSIRIYNPEELPFGLLSNNFNYKMFIDGEEWDNVSQYIYTSLIPQENKHFRDILKKVPYNNISNKYLEFESSIKDTFVKDILIKSLEQRFDDEEKRKYLLETGNSRLFYINENNLFFGTKESLIPKLKSLDYTDSKNVLGYVFEEIRRRLHLKIIETDLLKQYIKLLLLNDTVIESYSKIIDLMALLHDKTNENKQLIFDGFIKQFDSNSVEINVDEYKKQIENDLTLLKVLIISKTNPSCLVLYSLHKTIRKSNDKIKKQLSGVVFEKYLNYFAKINNVNKSDIEDELKLLKKDYLEKILFSLYEKKLLPTALKNEISTYIKDKTFLKEDVLKSYDYFNAEAYVNDEEIFNNLKITEPSKKDFLFTDNNPILSIFGEEALFLEGKTYSNVDKYIQEKIGQNEFFNHDKRVSKINMLCLNGLNAKYKFENYSGVLDRHTLDLHHILYLAKDKNIIQLDEISLISTLTSGYLNYHSKNSVNINNIISQYENDDYNLDEFLDNDLFLNRWFMNIIKNFSTLVSNMFFFIEKKFNENMKIDSNFVKNVHIKLYGHDENINKNNDEKMPEYISNHLKLLFEALNDKIIDENSFKKTIWELFYSDLIFLWKSIGNESKQSDLKNIIYNVQIILSESQSQFIVLDDPLDNSICLASINLLKKINEFSSEYLSVDKIYNKYYNDFKTLNIEKFQFKNTSELIKEISKKNDVNTKNLLGNILFEISQMSLIKNEDLINVFGIITNVNTYRKPIDQNSEKTTKYDFYDEYEEGVNVIRNYYDNEDEEEEREVVLKTNEKSKNEDDEDEYGKKTRKDKEYDDDLNDEFEEAVNEMYNEDKEDDENDGNFDQNRMKTEIDKFLRKQTISNIKSDVIIYLIDVIKNHSKVYLKSDGIIKNRCNFFQYTSTIRNITDTKVKQPEAATSSVIDKNILKDIKYVTGIKGGLTASETWILELLNKTKLFGKIFINIDNNSSNLIFDNESKKENFFLSSKSLDYEKRIYKDIVGPMKKLKICKHFVPLIDVIECDYKTLLDILTGHTYDSISRKLFDKEKLDYILKRNIDGMINMNKKLKINEYDSNNIEIIKNGNDIEKLNFTLLITKYFDIENDITSLTRFLETYYRNKDVILQVLFQLAVVCYAISLCNMTHNDLHADNVFIKKLDSLQTFIYYINDQKYEIKTFFKVYIFDFNFSYVEKFGLNEGVNDYLCENFSVCNEFIGNKDILKILCAIYKFYPESLKYTTSNIEKQKIIEKLYVEDKECFFRNKASATTMGKSVRSDFFKQFNSSLNILKMIYIDIPKNETETLKTSEQTIKPFLDGSITSNDVENLSFIKEEHFIDGQIDPDGQVKYISNILSSNSNSYPELVNEYSPKTKESEPYPEKIIEEKEPVVEEKEPVVEEKEEEEEEEPLDEKEIINNKNNMIKLFENGYSIFKGYKGNQLNSYFSEQLEFKNNSEKDTNFSAFAALCKHPSSFHHKEIRKIRMNIYKDFVEKFKLYFPKMKIRMLFDCLCCITKKSKYNQCNFSDDFRKDDLVFRGFVNLNDSGNQYFHYKRLDKQDENIFKEIIFPKHVVLYSTKNIEECDYSTDNENETDYRLYFGFQLSKNDKNDKDNLGFIETQSIPEIYGLVQELWTDEELKNWSVKLKQYSKKFIKSMLNEDGIVHKNPSLKSENSIIDFNPYTDEEINIYKFTPL
jgi:predicted NAD-dependent protein-ADP-ribosyltransferase YbiA (DUF1768 family)